MKKKLIYYDWQSSDAPDSFEYILPALVRILSLRVGNSRNIRILDVGSGNGFLCSELSKLGFKVTGFEPDEGGYLLSKNKYPTINFYNVGVDINLSKLFVNYKNLFDVVISTEVIEHLYSPDQLPQLANRVLVDNGYIIISTPYHGYLKNIALSLMNKWDFHHHPLKEGGHIKFWSRKTLSTLLKDNGFEVVNFLGVGRVKYLWKSMILVAQKKNDIEGSEP